MKNTPKKVIPITHNIGYYKENIAQRFQEAEKMLKTYQGASLVVTSRLHVALPCLALKTPVLLLKDNLVIRRFDTFVKILNTISTGDLLAGGYNINTPTKNPDAYILYRDMIKKAVQNFIKVNEESSIEQNLRPED